MTGTQVSKFKTHFSEIMSRFKSSEDKPNICKPKEYIAAIKSYQSYKKRYCIKLGILRTQKYCIKDDFAMTVEEMLGL